MASIRFELQNKGRATGPVRAIIQQGKGNKVPVNTGYSLPTNKLKDGYKFWDSKKRIAKGHEDALKINAVISSFEAIFNNYIEHCQQFNKAFSMAEITTLLKGHKSGKSKDVSVNATKISISKTNEGKTTFAQCATIFLDSLEYKVKKSVVKQYEVVVDHIAEISKKQNKEVLLDDINLSFYNKFAQYCINEQGNINNTILRKVRRIKKIVRFGLDEGLTNNSRYTAALKLKESPAARFALWDNEVAEVEKIITNKPLHRLCIDAFLFSCYTTLRHSDVTQLTKGNLQYEKISGKEYPILNLSQIKTCHINSMALSDKALAIWNKYAEDITDDKKTVFHLKDRNTAARILKQYFKNDKLKLDRECLIVRTIGNKTIREHKPLYEVINYHMSRNTAITNQLADLPTELVMENAGIKSYKTLKGYTKDNTEKRHLLTYEALNKKSS